MPGGFGYYRRLRRLADPGYVWERDRDPVRARHRGTLGLAAPDPSGFVARDYASYAEYVRHQRQKLDEMLRSGSGFSNEAVATYRRVFYRRFRHLVGLLPRDARILCLGARQGTEVEVLRELGFRHARGVDLNPGPGNRLVRVGDFHDLDEPDGSIDLVYSNSLDHVYDLERFLLEQRRVLVPGGYALFDVHAPYRQGENVAFESLLWPRDTLLLQRLLAHFGRLVRAAHDGAWTWVLLADPLPVAPQPAPAWASGRRSPGRRRRPVARAGERRAGW